MAPPYVRDIVRIIQAGNWTSADVDEAVVEILRLRAECQQWRKYDEDRKRLAEQVLRECNKATVDIPRLPVIND